MTDKKIIYVKAPKLQMAKLDFKAIIKSRAFSKGKFITELESALKDKFKVEHAICTSSATQALYLAVKTFKQLYISNKKHPIGLIPAFTWWSTRYAFEWNDYDLKYADIRNTDWLMMWNKLMTEDCDLIMPVDTFGNPIETLAPHNTNSVYSELNDKTIIDAAHSIGIPNVGNRVLAEVVSFAGTKIITGGEGGVLLTDNYRFGEKFTTYRDVHSRMNEFSAMVVLNQLGSLDKYLQLKRKVYNKYKRLLGKHFTFQDLHDGANHWTVAVLCKSPDERFKIMQQCKDIEFKVYFKPVCRTFGHLPNTKDIYSRILCLPSWDGVDVGYVCESILGVVE